MCAGGREAAGHVWDSTISSQERLSPAGLKLGVKGKEE